jgi:hypothetical protein
VKRSSRLTTPPAERSIPPTTVLANAAPGSVGRVICRPPPPEVREPPEVEERPPPRPELAVDVRVLRTIGTQGR